MKTIYLVIYDELEVEGFLDENGMVLGYWALNDAQWRSEYFNYVFETLNIEIKRGTKEMCENFGAFMENEWN